MMKKFEIAENPEILLDKEFNYNLVQLEGHNLNGDYRKINIDDVTEVHVENYEEPYANLKKQIEQFDKHNGWIHMAGNFAFAIKNQKISQIILRGKYIDDLMKLKSTDIINFHGNPDKILIEIDPWEWAEVEDATILVYSNKKLYFFIDSRTKKVSEIRIGNVNEKYYSSPENMSTTSSDIIYVIKKLSPLLIIIALVILIVTVFLRAVL